LAQTRDTRARATAAAGKIRTDGRDGGQDAAFFAISRDLSPVLILVVNSRKSQIT
jgi:hypothetical protein